MFLNLKKITIQTNSTFSVLNVSENKVRLFESNSSLSNSYVNQYSDSDSEHIFGHESQINDMANYLKMSMSLKHGWGSLVVHLEIFIEKFFI